MISTYNCEQNYIECLFLPLSGYKENKKCIMNISMIQYFNILYIGNYNKIKNIDNIKNVKSISNIQENKIIYDDIKYFIPTINETMSIYLEKNKYDLINTQDNDI